MSRSHLRLAQWKTPEVLQDTAHPTIRARQSALLGYRILQVAFILTPILVGIDKFFHIIVNWEQYLSPIAIKLLGSRVHLFMKLAGIAEISCGVGMIFKPKIFSYFVSAWLIGIVINLLLTGAYFDIALRDFVLALSTFALGRFSDSFGGQPRT